MSLKKIIYISLFYFSIHFTNAQIVADSILTNQLQEVIVIGSRTERSVATLPLPTQTITGDRAP